MEDIKIILQEEFRELQSKCELYLRDANNIMELINSREVERKAAFMREDMEVASGIIEMNRTDMAKYRDIRDILVNIQYEMADILELCKNDKSENKQAVLSRIQNKLLLNEEYEKCSKIKVYMDTTIL